MKCYLLGCVIVLCMAGVAEADRIGDYNTYGFFNSNSGFSTSSGASLDRIEMDLLAYGGSLIAPEAFVTFDLAGVGGTDSWDVLVGGTPDPLFPGFFQDPVFDFFIDTPDAPGTLSGPITIVFDMGVVVPGVTDFSIFVDGFESGHIDSFFDVSFEVDTQGDETEFGIVELKGEAAEGFMINEVLLIGAGGESTLRVEIEFEFDFGSGVTADLSNRAIWFSFDGFIADEIPEPGSLGLLMVGGVFDGGSEEIRVEYFEM